MSTLAAWITRNDATHLHTDCESALKRIQKYQPSNSNCLEGIWPLLHINYLSNGKGRTKWVPSHPERTTPQNQWTLNQWGIFLADNAISPSFQPNLYFRSPIKQHALPLSQILDWLTPQIPFWHWRDAQDRLSLKNIKTALLDYYHQEYLTIRDTSTEVEPWATRHYSLIPKQFGSSRSSLATQARTSRLIYDKYFHGRNRRKAKLNPSCICGHELEDVPHILQICQNKLRQDLRAQFERQSTLHIQDLQAKQKHQNYSTLLTLQRLLLSHHSFAPAWCGTWTNNMINILGIEDKQRLQTSDTQDIIRLRTDFIAILQWAGTIAPSLITKLAPRLPQITKRKNTGVTGILSRRVNHTRIHQMFNTAGNILSSLTPPQSYSVGTHPLHDKLTSSLVRGKIH